LYQKHYQITKRCNHGNVKAVQRFSDAVLDLLTGHTRLTRAIFGFSLLDALSGHSNTIINTQSNSKITSLESIVRVRNHINKDMDIDFIELCFRNPTDNPSVIYKSVTGDAVETICVNLFDSIMVELKHAYEVKTRCKELRSISVNFEDNEHLKLITSIGAS